MAATAGSLAPLGTSVAANAVDRGGAASIVGDMGKGEAAEWEDRSDLDNFVYCESRFHCFVHRLAALLSCLHTRARASFPPCQMPGERACI